MSFYQIIGIFGWSWLGLGITFFAHSIPLIIPVVLFLFVGRECTEVESEAVKREALAEAGEVGEEKERARKKKKGWSSMNLFRKLVVTAFLLSLGALLPSFIFLGWSRDARAVDDMFSSSAALANLHYNRSNYMYRNLSRRVGTHGGEARVEDVIIFGETERGLDLESHGRWEEVKSKRDFIRQMMKDAWDNYAKYAWGHNELRPISQRGHSASVFGPAKIGATIVDALDTLYIMGMDEEFKQARDWIENSLDFDNIKAELSVFETNIRYVGGLLTAYAMTGDTMFKDKAYQLGKKLLPAFETPTGIPYALISLNSGSSKNYGWAASGSSILSEFGSLHLEFVYLSDVTGDSIFREKAYKIRDVIRQLEKPKGLYYNYVHPRMAKFTQSHVSMGALGDSFYEYLIKSYIQTGDLDARQMYDDAIDAFEKNGLIRYSKSGLLYFAEMRYDRLESKMDHLACFSGGMLALGAQVDPTANNNHNHGSEGSRASRHMKIAEGITHTCHESYIRATTRLGPESFRFSDALEARALRQSEKYYILRPEVIEAYFYMWRLTGDPKYREWAWDAAQSIEKYCKSGEGGGYSGLRNVYSKDPQQDDVQQSFFLAETLKYLYLMFSSKELVDLDYWVYNTEAHPLPIKGKNPLYRAHS